MESDSKSGPTKPGIKLVTIDVKMQIRTLHAKITFLQKTGGMTEEIERMMTELTALCNKDNSLSTTRTPAPAATTVFPKLLLKPETMQADSEYTGPNLTHLLMMPGDTIIVYAYINERVRPQPHEKVEIFIATGPHTAYDNSPCPLSYKTGQYVRVCSWETSMCHAYGFNLSTLDMGMFDVRYQFKKIEWPKEI
ncbi:hypothetical protein BTUL_0239g00010 [Botrytis tulipae]|uniref:Uncharacterized protein n=1 Tax=Botrytis tulipae TaxID=87230 RepID=A0A4Z1EEQ7_9HELO|nr:hypothetical protein BTUL_0239g00010 [Botrytis tulipae]